jgi:hypothetical protein
LLDSLEANIKLTGVPGGPFSDFEVAACTTCDQDSDGGGFSARRKATNGWASLFIPRDPARLNRPFVFFDHLVATFTDQQDFPRTLIYFFPPLRESPSFSDRIIISKTYAADRAQDVGITLNWDDPGAALRGLAHPAVRLRPGHVRIHQVDPAHRLFRIRALLSQ